MRRERRRLLRRRRQRQRKRDKRERRGPPQTSGAVLFLSFSLSLTAAPGDGLDERARGRHARLLPRLLLPQHALYRFCIVWGGVGWRRRIEVFGHLQRLIVDWPRIDRCDARDRARTHPRARRRARREARAAAADAAAPEAARWPPPPPPSARRRRRRRLGRGAPPSPSSLLGLLLSERWRVGDDGVCRSPMLYVRVCVERKGWHARRARLPG
jgi:hypothetical protein